MREWYTRYRREKDEALARESIDDDDDPDSDSEPERAPRPPITES
jgi:hypothetical protein